LHLTGERLKYPDFTDQIIDFFAGTALKENYRSMLALARTGRIFRDFPDPVISKEQLFETKGKRARGSGFTKCQVPRASGGFFTE
jgi:hypothetical protein